MLERRALVRLLVRAGTDEISIAKKLLEANYLPALWPIHKQVKFIRYDIAAVRREDAARFTVVYQEAHAALHEYLARQEYLYTKSVENGDYELAAKLSKDIARAHGVVTEEPVRVETDILTQMGEAFALAEKKLLARKQQSLPPPELVMEGEVISPSVPRNGPVTRD